MSDSTELSIPAGLINSCYQKIPQTHPKNPERSLWTGFSSDNVLHAGRKEAQSGRIHRGLEEVLFPVPERG